MIFSEYIGIDYSGAQTPTASLKGLRIYAAEGEAAPVEILPPPSPRTYWTRKGSPAGWSNGSPRMSPRWSGSTTGSHSRFTISKRIALNRTGPGFSTIFSGI